MSSTEEILTKIKKHCSNNLYSRISRAGNKKSKFSEISRGYILDYSRDFLLFREEEDFLFTGLNIIPIKYVKSIRYNANDKYLDFINKSEYDIKEFQLNNSIEIDLTSWESIFDSLKSAKKVVISECEKLKHDYFAIGDITKFNKNSVFINHFDAQGNRDKDLVKHKYNWITKITFDDNYSRVFSKYIKE